MRFTFRANRYVAGSEIVNALFRLTLVIRWLEEGIFDIPYCFLNRRIFPNQFGQ